MKEHLRQNWLLYLPLVGGVGMLVLIKAVFRWGWSDAVFLGVIALGVLAEAVIAGLLVALKRRDDARR